MDICLLSTINQLLFSPLISASSPLVDFSLSWLGSRDWLCLAELVREGTATTEFAVLIGWLDTSPTELTVTVRPSVLAGADSALMTVVVANMDPVLTVCTVAVLRTSQLHLSKSQVGEDPEREFDHSWTLVSHKI